MYTPYEGDVSVGGLPALDHVLDHGDDVPAAQQVDQPVQQHLLDLQLGQDLQGLVALLEQPHVQPQNLRRRREKSRLIKSL